MKRENTYIAIMAGGVGSRFWPYSREMRPKQFLDILNVGKSLIRLTFERFLNLVDADHIFILTNEKYRALVKEHLPEIPNENIIGEPSRNNTAPCIAYTALKLHNLNPEANMVVAPSDHVILKETEFLNKIKSALQFADENEALLTLGIEPSRPDTGYGYIKREGPELKLGSYKVERFTEKPDKQTAQSFLDEGSYLWNAGIFIWKTKNIIASFQQNANQIIETLTEDISQLNTEGETEYIKRVYPNTESISIDYAILEKAKNVYTIPADIAWSDLGTWNSLHAYLDKDDNGNVISKNSTLLFDVKNSLVKLPEGKMLVAKDLEGYFIIDDGQVLLIYPKEEEQAIKQVRQSIDDQNFL